MILRLYESQDWDKINAFEPFMVPVNSKDYCNGLAVTAIDNERVIGCGGIVFIKEIGMVWVRLDKDLGSHIRMARTILRMFNTMCDLVGDMKVIAYVLDCFERGERLASFVGLKKNCKKIEFNGNIYNRWNF